jgi:hypothetical protein
MHSGIRCCFLLSPNPCHPCCCRCHRSLFEERPGRLVSSPQGTCGATAGVYRSPRGVIYVLGGGNNFPSPQKRKNSLGLDSFISETWGPSRYCYHLPPSFGEISVSRAQGFVDTPPVRPRGLAHADWMSATVEGMGKETFYTSHGVRLGKMVAFNPRESKRYTLIFRRCAHGGSLLWPSPRESPK